MGIEYKSSLRATPFRFRTAATSHAEKKFPAIVWGGWHQGPDGKNRIVGKLGEADDPVIVTERRDKR